MQKITTNLPYEVITTPCGGCTNSSDRCGCRYAAYAGIPITLAICNQPISTTRYNPYTNNMIAINGNFDHVAHLNQELKRQIEQQNQAIRDLRIQLEQINGLIQTNNTHLQEVRLEMVELQHHITTVDHTIADNIVRLEHTETEIKLLVKKIGIIINYLPQFVRDTSMWFMRLLIGIKTDQISDLEALQYDTKLIDNLDVIKIE